MNTRPDNQAASSVRGGPVAEPRVAGMTRDATLERPLLHSFDAERAILGAVLLDNRALDIAVEKLRPEDFFLDQHRRVFEHVIGMGEKHEAIDLVTLTDSLERCGQLEAAGGAACLAQLLDGVPRISNVEHYARIVAENSELRRMAACGEAIALAALDGDPEAVRAHARTLAESRPSGCGLRVVSAEDLLIAELPPVEMVVDPILPAQGLMEIFSQRGVGKTYLALEIADAVSCGRPCLRWQVPRARRVLYVDGELPASVLRDRLASIRAGAPLRDSAELEPALLQFLTPDFQAVPMPDLSTRIGQEMVERELDGVEVLILDSISTLCRSGKENEGESWLPVQEWLLRLRQRGLSAVFLHHAGKAGMQRGTSRREDVLNTVVALRHPTDYSPREGLRFEVHFEKLRAHIGDEARPFEVKLHVAPEGVAAWTMRDVEDALRSRAYALFEDGLTIRDIADELKVSRSTVGRWRKRWQSRGAGGGQE